ncbi:MAG: hydroxymethylbilane synthase [SAR202 cluster bacterium Io17-Chloro-G9]|nr:MAG: hydroxymethylbilane synthase [SAR202 cluster bacterium Io17-Chloro-G9]
MANAKTITLGSRGSALALVQDDEVISRLKARSPGLEITVDTVRTRGDADQVSPLAGMGLGIFVKELEQELLDGKLDMAVHSLKDMPTELTEGLILGAVLSRQDARDALVNRWNCNIQDLPAGAKIGTSSPRRAAQLKRHAPQATVVPLRGNVETRLRKAAGEEADGAVLAAAGLIRLGLEHNIAEYLSPQRFVPPPGQGVLAVEIRADDQQMRELLAPIEDADTRLEASAERAFLEVLGGGCQVPIGAYARCVKEMLQMSVFIGSEDGETSFIAEIEGPKHDSLQLANDAYQALAKQGGGDLLRQAKESSA